MKKFARLLILFVMLVAGSRPLSVSADSGINQIDITVSDTKTQKVVPNVSLSIYRVAEGQPTALEMAEAFAGAGIQVKDFEQTSKLEMITQKLEEYLVKQKIEPLDTKVSDHAGKILFSNLQNGVYLITQNEDSDSGYHTPAFLISAPKMDENGEYISRISCHPKGSIREKITRIVVNKIWKDTNNSSTRPNSITVALYKDGILEDQVNLTAEMNWYYEWKNLDSKAEWAVEELNIPKGYVSSIKMVDGVCTIINTKEKVVTQKSTIKTVKKVKTGDDANILLLAILLGFSAIISLCIVIRKTKKK